MLKQWLRRRLKPTVVRIAPEAEWLEPRLLYSADPVSAWLAAAAPNDATGEIRTLSATGEYTAVPAAAATETRQLDAPARQAAIEAYATTALSFERNEGQEAAGIDFTARGPGYSIALAGGSAGIAFSGSDSGVLLQIVGANPSQAQGEGLLQTRSNSMVGDDASRWRNDIANYAGVRYDDIYAGVDVRYYGTQRQLEYDFDVAAGADASNIRLKFAGAETQIDAEGNLLLRTADGRELHFAAPVSYQLGAAGREAVSSAYQLFADGTVGFTLGAYDTSRALVIDPVLRAATYFGDSGTESAADVAVDSSGAVYVTGTTNSTGGGLLGGLLSILSPPTGVDIYVAKFDANLSSAPAWTTRLGGGATDQPFAITVDAAGNVIVAGRTQSNDFPTSATLDRTLAGPQDGVLFKLNGSNGNQMFGTYIGDASNADSANAVAVDAAGNIYVTGAASPVSGSGTDAFLARYTSGGALVWQVKYGGDGADLGRGIAVDAAGNIYVVGDSSSNTMQTPGGADTSGVGKDTEGFLARFDSNGNVVYGTFIGADKKDFAAAVAVDAAGRAYVVGQTEKSDSGNFYTSPNALDQVGVDNFTGYLRIYDTNATGAASLVYSTLLGGTGDDDNPTDVALMDGRVVVVSETNSNNFAVTSDAVQSTNPGKALHVDVINPASEGAFDLQWATYYGKSMTGGGVAIGGQKIYVTGSTNVNGYGKAGSYATSTSGGQDGLIVAFDATNAAPVLNGGNAVAIFEDPASNNGVLVSALTSTQVTDTNYTPLFGIAITDVSNANGTWQYSVNGGGAWTALGGQTTTAALLLTGDAQTRVRFVPAADFSGTSSISFRAWDRTTGTAGGTVDTTVNGGSSPYSSSIATSVMTVQPVNDAPVRTAGTVANLAVVEASPATSLGLSGVAYGPGGGADESTQTFTFTVTGVPAATLGSIVLADGITTVTANTAYTLGELQGMQFLAGTAQQGTGIFSFRVTDSGGTANGGANSVAESLTITVTHQAPVLTGVNPLPSQREDSTTLTGTLVRDMVAGWISDPNNVYGIAVVDENSPNGQWFYTRDGGNNWFNFNGVNNGSARLLNADALTKVAFVPNNDWNGTAAGLTFRAWDRSVGAAGTNANTNVNGGTSAFSTATMTATVVVTPVNDAPVRTGGVLGNKNVTEGAAASLGLATLNYAPGGGADEASQALTYTVSALPPATFGSVQLAGGAALVLGNSYTPADLRGLQFLPAAGVTSGTASFGFTVSDDGGVLDGGVDTLSQSLTITVVNAAPVLAAGAYTLPTVAEDPASNDGMLVSALVSGGITDPNNMFGIAVTAAASPNGAWQYSRDDGASWSGFAGVTNGNARLLAADGQTRVRFVPNANYNGSATGLTFRAWDQSSGTAGGTGNTTPNGGSTAYSTATATASITITPVDDPSVLAADTRTVNEDSNATGNVLTNDVDIDNTLSVATFQLAGDPATYTAGQTATVPLVGSFTLAANGAYTFTPVANWNGDTPQLTYTTNTGSSSTLDIHLNAIDDPSVLVADTNTTDEDTVAAGNVLTNDSDVDTVLAVATFRVAGDAATYTAGQTATVAGKGSFTLATDGSYSFAPLPNVNGAMPRVSYTTNSGMTSTLDIALTAINDIPLAAGATAGGAEDASSIAITLTGSDVEGPVASVQLQSLPGNGLLYTNATLTTLAGTGTDYAGSSVTLYFVPAANFNGSSSFSYAVKDGQGAGSAPALATITVSPVNDAPVRSGGSLAARSVPEGATTSLALGALAYQPGGGADEAGQLLTYRVTALPATGFGAVQLANGIALVAGNSYSLAQLQGLQFQAAAGVTSGTGVFGFTVSDDGGTAAGGVDTLAQSLAITVVNQAPVLDGVNTPDGLLEDEALATNLGTLVSDLLAGHVTDPNNRFGMAAVATDNSNGAWQYSIDGGTSWSALSVSATSARLLAADGLSRVRFIPNPNFNGVAALTLRAWDQTTGTAGGTADTSSNGGSSAFSAATANASVLIAAVNDQPVLAGGALGNLSVAEGSLTSLGFSSLNYTPGGGADEAGQVLTYTITTVPAAAVGQVVLADGATVVAAGSSYTLTQLQGMQFRAGIGNGSGSFAFNVADSGGTVNGGVDTLSQGLVLTVSNQAPVLNGANALAGLVEDAAASNGTAVSALLAGQVGDAGGAAGLAVVAVDTSNGTWQYSTDGSSWNSLAGVNATAARLLAADGVMRVRYLPAADFSGTSSITFRAWDRTTGTAGALADTSSNGGSTAFSTATAASTVSVAAVNDAPVRLAGTVANLTVVENSAATSLGLGALAYGPGGGADEAAQTLAYTVNTVPAAAVGQLVLADGSTVVAAGSYTLADIQGMKFRPAAGATGGTGSFSFTVTDSGGTANGGVATRTESLTLTVVNQAPSFSSAPANLPAILEDSAAAAGTLVSTLVSGHVSDPGGVFGMAVVAADVANGSWQYSTNGGTSWQSLGGVSDTAARLLAADAQTRVRFVPNANFAGTAAITFRAWDRSTGTAGASADTSVNGGTSAFSSTTAASSIAVTGVNDAPVLTAGAVNNLGVIEHAGATSLGLGSIAYAPGPASATDEAAQTLTYTVTSVPAAAVGQVMLADHSTVVTSGTSYSLAQLRGMEFLAGSAANGSGTFRFTVKDNGGTANSGSDTLTQTLTITVTNQAPVLSGANALADITEDPSSNPGTAVTDLVANRITDPGNVFGIAVTAVDSSHGTWQYSTNGGASWSGLAGVSGASARLLAADAQTRVRFVPVADWNGSATITFRAWDRSSGAAGATADTTTNGGATAFSTATAAAAVNVLPVDDAPVRTAGVVANLTVLENSGVTSLNLGGLVYAPGGGADETSQGLTYQVTAVPSSLGDIVLADGTTVVSVNGTFSLAQLQGMQFRAGTNATGGPQTFGWRVQDSGGTANGGVDILSQSLDIQIANTNQAPVLAGGNSLADIDEDAMANSGTFVSALLAGHVVDLNVGALGGMAVTGVDTANGSWQYSTNGGTSWLTLAGVSSSSARLLAADSQTKVRFVPAGDWNGSANLSFRAWDRTSGSGGGLADTSVNGGTTAFSLATATSSVTVREVNDAPVRTGGTVAGLTVLENSGVTSLGLAGLAHAPGGGADEAAQTLTYTVIDVPTTIGAIVLADGSTVVTVNGVYTAAELAGMQFRAASNATGGPEIFSWRVQDSGGTANGGIDALTETLDIQIATVNQPPVLNGANDFDNVLEDAASNNGTLVTNLVQGHITDGNVSPAAGIAVIAVDETNGRWEYSLNGGSSWASLTGVNDSAARLLAADGQTRVRFVAAADWNGTVANGLGFRAWDRTSGTSGGIADASNNGGISAFSTQTASSSVTVLPVNDAPVRSGTVSDLTVLENSGLSSLGLAGLVYGAGGGADENAQTLTYTVTAVPTTLGDIVLADGTTVVSANTVYTLADLQGMQFRAGSNASGGPQVFSWQVQDSGGTANGGVDLVSASLAIQIANTNQAPVLNGANPLAGIDEDATGNNGTLVSALVAGRITDRNANAVTGIAVVAVDAAHGAWEYSTDGGGSWASLATVSDSAARLLADDGNTRVRFLPAPDWNGSAGLTFRAWDRTAGVAGGLADASVNGLATAFSTATAQSMVDVQPVNDAPVRTAGAVVALTASENSAPVSLGLGALAYGAGGATGTAETQVLTFTVTAIPPAGLGHVLLADGVTQVSAGSSYTLADLQGMKFRPATGVYSGSTSFGWRVSDDGGTSNGGLDTLQESMAISIVNVAPVLNGSNPLAAVLEDSASNPGTLVSDLVSGQATDPAGLPGIAVIGVDSSNGQWEWTTDGGANWSSLEFTTPAAARLLGVDGQTRVRFIANPDWNGSAALDFRAWDQTSGSAGGLADVNVNGGSSAFSSATAQALATTDPVNDAPLQTAGAVNNLAVVEGAPATSLGLGTLAYTVGGGADEASQTLSVSVTALPSAIGNVLLADGSTLVTLGATYTVADLQGMQFRVASGVHGGSGNFAFAVIDGGGTANGGVDRIHSSLTISVSNVAPTLTGADAMAAIAEDDVGNSGTLVSTVLGNWVSDPGGVYGMAVTGTDSSNGRWQYTLDGGMSWSTLDTASDSAARLLPSDAQARVRFIPNADWNGSATFSFRAWDQSSGTAGAVANTSLNGGSSAFSSATQTSTAVVSAVNDPPVRTAGSLVDLTVVEEAPATSLGLGGLAYGVGGGADEAATQTLAVTVTALPGAGLGDVLLADGTTLVTNGASYTVGQLQGMQFRPTSGVSSGDGVFSFSVSDGTDSITGSMAIHVLNQAPELAGANPLASVLEDTPAASNAGTLVSTLIAGQVTDASSALGIAVIGVDGAHGSWQYSTDGGTAWSSLDTVSLGAARLLSADALTRVRFLPGSDWTGSAGLSFVAWEGAPADADSVVDASVRGGSSKFSADTATATVDVQAVNDAPVRTGGALTSFSVPEGSGATSLGLAGLAYSVGGGIDEAATQSLTFTITGIPTAIGSIVLADGTTPVTLGGSYTLAELQGMQFRAAPTVSSGSSSFSFTVVDNGGTASGGQDTLAQTQWVSIVNQAPVLAGANAMTGLLEDVTSSANTGTLVSDLVAGHATDPVGVKGIAVIAVDSGAGNWEYTLDGGTTWASLNAVAGSAARLLAADGTTRVRFLPQPDSNGSAAITFRAWDGSSGNAADIVNITATGGTSAYSAATAASTVTVAAVNDAPVRTSALPANLPVNEGSGATSLGLASVSYAAGGGSDEAGQALQFTLTAVPATSLGDIVLADGSTVVGTGSTLTLTQLRGLQFRVAPAATGGSASFGFSVRDDGGTLSGGVDTLMQTLTITVVDQPAPVLDGSANALPTQVEDAGADNGIRVIDLISGHVTQSTGTPGIAVTAASSPLGTWEFSTDGGTGWSSLAGVSDSNARLLGADAFTRVRFVANADASGPATGLVFRAWDQSGGTAGQATGDTTVNGGNSPYSAATASAQVSITAVNDAPVRTSAAPAAVAAAEGSTIGLGLGGLSYAVGGGADEALAQTLTVRVTGVASSMGDILLADGTTVVTAGSSYTIAQLQGMQLRAGTGVSSGSGTFSFDIVDDGGTSLGGQDTLSQAMGLSVFNQAPVLNGANAMTGTLEDAPAAAGTLVSDLIAGQATDASGIAGIAVTAVDSSRGNWQYTTDGGVSWSSLNTASTTAARLLAADSLTRVRFVPQADWNGSAALGLRAWDGTSGSAGATADTTVNGGTTAFSSAVASSSVTVTAVNDAPVLASGVLGNLSVDEGSGTSSLGLGSVSYRAGGGGDEAAESLTFTVSAVPLPGLGSIVLADGTTVVGVGANLTLAELQGLQFRASPISSGGSGAFGFSVRDDGGTLSGGVDTLMQTLTITVVDQPAPVLDGSANALPTQVEDAGADNGIRVIDLISGHVTQSTGTPGIAVTSASSPLGTWEFSTDGGTSWSSLAGVSDSNARLLGADAFTRVRFVANADASGPATGLVFRAWDQSGGTAGQATGDTTVNGGNSPYSAATASAQVSITAVNDAPVRTSAAPAAVAAAEGSTIGLGLGGLSYAVGGGVDEALAQTLTVHVTGVASSIGDILLADGTTVVTAGSSYTIAQLQGMQFRAGTGVSSGSGTFSFDIVDDGGTSLGGQDTLSQAMGLSVFNQAPVLNGANAMTGTLEDAPAAAGTLVSDLIAGQATDASGIAGIAVTAVDSSRGNWQYTTDGGVSWSSLNTASTTAARLLAADSLTRVRFVPQADWNGSAALGLRAWDGTSGSAGATADTTVNGGTTAFSSAVASSTMAVVPVNDAPVRTGATPSAVSINEGSAATSLGFGGLAYSVGGGADEAAGQQLQVVVTAVPPSSLGDVLLADGVTVVTASGRYTIGELRGMQFRPASAALEGSAAFDFSITDDGGTANGGSDTLRQGVAVRVVPLNLAPVLAGVNPVADLLEDPTDNTGFTVASLLAGQVSDRDAGALSGIAVTQASSTGGSWQFSTDSGTTWSGFGSVSDTSARLLPADGVTRVRFVPVADWNGTATGLVFRAWDQSRGTAGLGTANTAANGGGSPFSAATAKVSLVVQPVNDPPAPTVAPPTEVSVVANGNAVPLGLQAASYTAGGGSDESTQQVTVRVTTVPPANVGTVVLADGRTAVVAGATYDLAQLRGMSFVAAPAAAGQTATIEWALQDDGGTAAGGRDALRQLLQVRIAAAPSEPLVTATPPVVAQPPAAAPAAPAPPPVVAAPAAAPAPAPARAAPAPAGGSEVATATGGGFNTPRQEQGFAATAVASVSVDAPRNVTARVADSHGVQLVGFQLASQQAADFKVTGFASYASQGVRITVEDFQQSLRSGAFLEELNRLRDHLRQDFNLDKTVSVSVAGVSLGASLLYVLWLIRGGVLVGSYLSALPAWRLLDPLPVLARAGDEEEDDDEDEALSPGVPGAPDPLRGFQ